MKFYRIIFSAFVVFALVSCTSEPPADTYTSTARLLTSEDGYEITVERGTGRMYVSAPEELSGVSFSFTETESYLESGEMKIPLSPEAAAPLRDFLVMAYPEDLNTAPEFEYGGAMFRVEYKDGVPAAVTAVRGNVERQVTLVEAGAESD